MYFTVTTTCILQVVAYFIFDFKDRRKIKEGAVWNWEQYSTYFHILLKLDESCLKVFSDEWT